MTQVAIHIPDDLQHFIDDSVKSGLFSDAAEFVMNVLHNAKAQSETELSEEQKAKLATLRAEVSVGLAQAGRAEFVEFSAEDIIASSRLRQAAV